MKKKPKKTSNQIRDKNSQSKSAQPAIIQISPLLILVEFPARGRASEIRTAIKQLKNRNVQNVSHRFNGIVWLEIVKIFKDGISPAEKINYKTKI